jgi:hypothetical protein
MKKIPWPMTHGPEGAIHYDKWPVWKLLSPQSKAVLLVMTFSQNSPLGQLLTLDSNPTGFTRKKKGSYKKIYSYQRKKKRKKKNS